MIDELTTKNNNSIDRDSHTIITQYIRKKKTKKKTKKKQKKNKNIKLNTKGALRNVYLCFYHRHCGKREILVKVNEKKKQVAKVCGLHDVWMKFRLNKKNSEKKIVLGARVDLCNLIINIIINWSINNIKDLRMRTYHRVKNGIDEWLFTMR